MNMKLSTFAVYEKVAMGANIIYSRFSSKWWLERMDVTKQVENLLAQGAVRSIWFVPKGSHLGHFIVVEQPDYSADSESGDAERITPDPAGETIEDVSGYYPTSAQLYHIKMRAMKRFGRYAPATVRLFAWFDNLYPQYKERPAKHSAQPFKQSKLYNVLGALSQAI